jgi:hypothetical protein
MEVDRRGFLRLVGLSAAAVATEPWLQAPTWTAQAFAPGGLVPIGPLVKVTKDAAGLVATFRFDRPTQVGEVEYRSGQLAARHKFQMVWLDGSDGAGDVLRTTWRR